MNHSSILLKNKVSSPSPYWGSFVMWPYLKRSGGAGNLVSLLCLWNDIMVVKDDINHTMSVVTLTKSRLTLQHGYSHVMDYLS